MDGVVVADEDLLSTINVPLGDDGHDVAEPRMVQFGEGGVGRERVARLVPQGRPVFIQTLLSLSNVEARVARQPDEGFKKILNI